MPVLGPPSRGLESALRESVLDHREHERRRRFPVRVHAGAPGTAAVASLEPPGTIDHALRTDLVAALLQRTRHVRAPLVWLTRAGSLHLHDADAAWHAAARAAYAQLGLDGVFVVVTRDGWRDPRHGASRTWVRLRRSSPRDEAAAPVP